MELRAVLEEVLDRKLGEAVRDISATLNIEFERLSRENESLAKELRQLPQFSRATSPVSAAPVLPAHSTVSSNSGSPKAQAGRTGNAAMVLRESEKSKASSSAPEDRYENLYDLTRAFRALCPSNPSGITVAELSRMSLHQEGLNPADSSLLSRIPRFGGAIQALNEELGSGKSSGGSSEITLDTFVAIMKKNKQVYSLDEEAVAIITQVRDILVREGASRQIAQATDVAAVEIYKAASHARVAQTKLQAAMQYLDPFIGVVIILNAIVICISTEFARDSDVWTWFDVIFSIIFAMEICVQLVVRGVAQFFCGPEMYWNIFDALIVTVAIADVIITMLGSLVNLGNFTIIRLLRFARLTKLVRVLKLKVFKELALMVNGILAGFRVLAWAVVFLGFLLFALGLLLTRTVGHEDASSWTGVCDAVDGPDDERACNSAQHLAKYHKELFGNVVRSMFTVFRCFIDGCSSVDGTPLIPYFYNTHGVLFVIIYMLIVLFVIFGLFNLIMAIFVQNTIDSAKVTDARRHEAQYTEHVRVALKLQELIITLCTGDDRTNGSDDDANRVTSESKALSWFRSIFATRANNSLSEGMELRSMTTKNLSLQVTQASFNKVLQKERVQRMLDDLDIDTSSRQSLFETLDANCNGTLEVGELANGLMKLRGQESKGDTVASLLAIRAMQKSIKAMEVLSLNNQQVMQNVTATQQRVLASLNASDAHAKEGHEAAPCHPKGAPGEQGELMSTGVYAERSSTQVPL